MPSRFLAVGSVRAMHIPKSAKCAQVLHTFCPVMTHSSPSRSARAASDARSDPAPGSEKSWHQISTFFTIFGRKRAFCSSVPQAMIVGPARLRPRMLSRPRL